MKNSTIIGLFALCLSLPGLAQEQLKITFKGKAQSLADINIQNPEIKQIAGQEITLNRPRMKGRVDISPVYLYKGEKIYYKSKKYKITPPSKANLEQSAFAFLYFTGWVGAPIANTTLIFLDNYPSESPKIYIDSNHNLDFSDDKKALKIDEESHSIILQLVNSQNSKAKYLTRLLLPGASVPPMDEQLKTFFQVSPDAKLNQILDEKYWLREIRMNYRATQTKVKNQVLNIGLVDWNVNGKFNDPVDRIMEPDRFSGFLSDKRSHGAVLLQDSPLIELNEQTYQVLEVEETGKYMRLALSQGTDNRLKNGGRIPDFAFQTLEGNTSNLYKYLNDQKYTVISVWGTWSRAFKQDLPALKKTLDQHSNKLQIIGFNTRDLEDRRRDKLENKEWVKNFVKNQQMNWPNVFANRGIIEKFMIDDPVTYILIDKEKKIIDLSLNLKELKNLLEQIQ